MLGDGTAASHSSAACYDGCCSAAAPHSSRPCVSTTADTPSAAAADRNDLDEAQRELMNYVRRLRLQMHQGRGGLAGAAQAHQAAAGYNAPPPGGRRAGSPMHQITPGVGVRVGTTPAYAPYARGLRSSFSAPIIAGGAGMGGSKLGERPN